MYYYYYYHVFIMLLLCYIRSGIPVLLGPELLDFALDAFSGRLEDDALQKEEVVLVEHLLLLQWTNDLSSKGREKCRLNLCSHFKLS